MDLSRINAVVRPRTPWEAMDLGFLMARTWAGPLWKAWFIVTLPFFLLVQVFHFFSLSYVAFVILWWLKPLWECVLLYLLSRLFFGETSHWRDALHEMKALGKKEWLLWLTWRRFSPTRAMDLSVTLLEKLSGAPRRERLQALHYNGNSGSFWLMSICLSIEQCLSLAAVTLGAFFIPEHYDFKWESFFELFEDELVPIQLALGLFEYLAISAIAPFFVAAGFSLYLNKRIIMEGWDIELIFRQLRQRSTTCILGLIFLGSLQLFSPSTALAQDLSQEQSNVKEQIVTVLEGEDFHPIETQFSWQLKEDIDFSFNFQWDSESSPFTDSFLWVARSFEVLLSIAFISLLLFLAYHYRVWLSSLLGFHIHTPPTEETLPPQKWMDQEKKWTEGLPLNNISSTVLALWKQGEPREALSFFYRTTLAQLIQVQQLDLQEGATEHDCVVLIKRHHSTAVYEFFKTLVLHWQNLAYGHRLPEYHTLESLCAQWEQLLAQHENG